MNTDWFVERHELGAVKITPARDMFERNVEAVKAGERVPWVVIGSARDMNEARELERELKRAIREVRTEDHEGHKG